MLFPRQSFCPHVICSDQVVSFWTSIAAMTFRRSFRDGSYCGPCGGYPFPYPLVLTRSRPTTAQVLESCYRCPGSAVGRCPPAGPRVEGMSCGNPPGSPCGPLNGPPCSLRPPPVRCTGGCPPLALGRFAVDPAGRLQVPPAVGVAPDGRPATVASRPWGVARPCVTPSWLPPPRCSLKFAPPPCTP